MPGRHVHLIILPYNKYSWSIAYSLRKQTKTQKLNTEQWPVKWGQGQIKPARLIIDHKIFPYTKYSWPIAYSIEKKVKMFCNVKFSLICLIISNNRITIFGICLPCKVLMWSDSFHLTLTSYPRSVNKVKFWWSSSDTISNRSTIFGVWKDCKVNMSSWQFSSYLDLIFMVQWSKLSF